MTRCADCSPQCWRIRNQVFFVSAAITLLASFAAFSQVANQILSEDELAKLYADHDRRVLGLLPLHSALPALLHLSKPIESGPGAGKKWEDRFTGSTGVRPVDYDPGVRSANELTSISTTTIEYAGQAGPLQARSCKLIIIGRPENASPHLAYNHRFVYSLYQVNVLELLKSKGRHAIKTGQLSNAAQLGGSIRFASGHQAFFWEANDGFMALNERYLLFLWNPVPSSDTYMVSEVFLLQNERVFPIQLSSGEEQYSDTPADQFIARAKKLISANKDGM